MQMYKLRNTTIAEGVSLSYTVIALTIIMFSMKTLFHLMMPFKKHLKEKVAKFGL